MARDVENPTKEYLYKSKLQHSGNIYVATGKQLFEYQLDRQGVLDEFNLTSVTELDKRYELMKEMFAEVGNNVYIEPPLNANFGGRFVHFGNNIYLNSNVTLVDDTHIYIGDYTMIAPNVVISTAAHPISPSLRKQNFQYNLPVHIGKNCWIGAGAIILPGVSIGDNTVIGAGSVVTKDIPENVVAFGNPCKVYRSITEEDEEYFKGPNGVYKIDPEVVKTEIENTYGDKNR